MTSKTKKTGDAYELFADMGEQDMVLAGSTSVDSRYGRRLYPALVKRIVENFQWSLFGRPMLSARPFGRYAILDGAHRIKAAVECFGEDVAVPVVILRGLDRKTEAWAFSQLNTTRRQLTAPELFSADLAAEEPEATAIMEMCTARDLKIREVTVGEHGAPRVIAAVMALRRIYRQSPELLAETLEILCRAWGDDSAGMHLICLGGVSRFLSVYPESDRQRLLTVMRRNGPDKLYRSSRDLAKMFTSSSGQSTLAARILLAWYNARLTRNPLNPTALGI